jgi:hypothetical protein
MNLSANIRERADACAGCQSVRWFLACLIVFAMSSSLRATEFIDWELVLEGGIHAQELFADHSAASRSYSRIHLAETAPTALLCEALARDVLCKIALEEMTEARQLFQQLTARGDEGKRWMDWLRGKVPELFFRKAISWTSGEHRIANWKHQEKGSWAGVSLLSTRLVSSDQTEFWRVSIQILARESLWMELDFDRSSLDLMASRMRRKQREPFELALMPPSEDLLASDWVGDAEVIAQMLRYYPLSLGYTSEVEAWSAQDAAWSRIAFDIPSMEVFSDREDGTRTPVYRVVLQDWQPRIMLWVEEGGDHLVRRMQVEDCFAQPYRAELEIDAQGVEGNMGDSDIAAPAGWVSIKMEAARDPTWLCLLPGSELRLWMQRIVDEEGRLSAEEESRRILGASDWALVSQIEEVIGSHALFRTVGQGSDAKGAWVSTLSFGGGERFHAVAVGPWQEIEQRIDLLDHWLRSAATVGLP